MSEININTVEKIAKLSRIAISESKKKEMSIRLGNMINWIEQLQEIDTEGVEPMFGVDGETLYREDIAEKTNTKEAILDNSADTKFDFYAVPKFVE